jgi:hypothetical protein
MCLVNTVTARVARTLRRTPIAIDPRQLINFSDDSLRERWERIVEGARA